MHTVGKMSFGSSSSHKNALSRGQPANQQWRNDGVAGASSDGAPMVWGEKGYEAARQG